MNKRGLSSIITTVLIILLAIIAVIMLWAFLRPLFQRSGVNIELQNECQNANVEPKQCFYINTSSDMYIQALVKQNSGNLESIVTVLSLSDGSITSETQDAPGIFSTRIFVSSYPYNNKNKIIPTTLQATALVQSKTDPTQNLTCDTAQTITCKKSTNKADLCDGIPDIADVDALVTAVLDNDGTLYHQQYPSCSWLMADFDCSAHVDFDDFDNFLQSISDGYDRCGYCLKKFDCKTLKQIAEQNGLVDPCCKD